MTENQIKYNERKKKGEEKSREPTCHITCLTPPTAIKLPAFAIQNPSKVNVEIQGSQNVEMVMKMSKW
jgi:hypothetical protein